MNTRLSLSIALTTYNGERYIASQLDSICRQTRQPDELIIFDDASIDRTPDLVLDFARRAPFPVSFSQNRVRLGSTRNFENAIRACTGDIIFLCDQDDVWYPNKVAVIHECFTAEANIGAVFTDADVVDANLHPLGFNLWESLRFSRGEQNQMNNGDALGVLFKHPVVTGATLAFRAFYRDLILPIPDMWHDAWISLLIGATSRLHALPSPLIAYRQHATNRLGIPRRGRNRGKTCAAIYGPQVQSYEMTLERLLQESAGFPVSENCLHRIGEILSFSRVRAALPHARLFRLPSVLHQLVALRYHKYAYGLYSLCKDLAR
ncbi:Glycosyl transferase family 2 [Nitrosospira multiformis]|uniref:Glycosyl transferase family 2 n=1 Tax=Nitrosospira multiformis TaxID=1231 RepID=A0A1H8NY41_9PROT|nr:glycosyltransferase family 2 protein [Nitrosospira multiformis]SEO34501.1 Glycosyl transferase family 2 [Nitrosospira multiformis]